MHNNRIVFPIILLLLFAYGASAASETDNSSMSPSILLPAVIDSDLVIDGQTVIINGTVTVTNGANLTIVNSEVNYNSTSYSIEVGGGSILQIVDSSLYGGSSRGIRGSDYGKVIVSSSSFQNFGNDVIRLDGVNESMGYDLRLDEVTISESSGDGIQVSYSVVVSNTLIIENLGGDGIKAELSSALNLTDTHIFQVGDEGIQADDNVTVYIADSSIENSVSHGLRVRYSNLPINLDSVIISNSSASGLKLVDVVEYNVTITNSIFSNNTESGIDARAVDSLTIENSELYSNSEYSIKSNLVQNMLVSESEISDTLYISDSNTTIIRQSSLLTDPELAINATMVGEGNLVLADYNYWGSTNLTYITENLIEGSVKVNIIFDEFGNLVNTTSTMVTSDTSSDVATTEGLSLSSYAFIIALFSIFVFRRNIRRFK